MDEAGVGTEIPPMVVEVEEWPLDDTALKYTLEVPGTMPLGKYKLVYTINGESLAYYAFEVKE